MKLGRVVSTLCRSLLIPGSNVKTLKLYVSTSVVDILIFKKSRSRFASPQSAHYSFCYFYVFYLGLVVRTSASDSLERFVCEVTLIALMGTLNPTHSLTRSLTAITDHTERKVSKWFFDRFPTHHGLHNGVCFAVGRD